ncbi:MAG: hypothetical protein WAV31_03375 [Candidatus Moraniibacteriota bacterium]
MYIDDSPVPNFPPSSSGQVIVIDKTDKDADSVIELARDEGATSIDADGDETFWVVFSDEPRRVWDFTEEALRGEIKKM